ncbi:MAG: hypothetical protein M3Z19_05895 [Chloroflexota bacterium]|nr:hypothetical protein [Chloroflexota bacterium]
MGNNRSRNRGNQTDAIAAQRGPWAGQDVFRLVLLALLIGQMLIYYDTATRAIPHINLYLLVNLALILLTLIPWDVLTRFVWLLVWPAGALMRWDWATRDTKSDVYWATSQGVYFLLHGMNPYTHVPTWVYDHQASAVNYPTYTYFPGSLFAEIPFYLLGNVRIGLALADLATALLIYLLARRALGVWPARSLTAFWLLFLPGFQVALLLAILDFFLVFWIALAVLLYARGRIVGSALAAAMVMGTKQYGFIFAIPWGILLIRPLAEYLWARWRAGERDWRAARAIPRRFWLPPVAGTILMMLVIAPLALLSPQAFVDSTYFHHAHKFPRPMLGTPQWNESIAAQVVALGGYNPDRIKPFASLALAVGLLVIVGFAVVKVRDMASALQWSAMLGGVFFAFNGGDVQFFYWRLPLFLFLLYVIVAWSPAQLVIPLMSSEIGSPDDSRDLVIRAASGDG